MANMATIGVSFKRLSRVGLQYGQWNENMLVSWRTRTLRVLHPLCVLLVKRQIRFN